MDCIPRHILKNKRSDKYVGGLKPSLVILSGQIAVCQRSRNYLGLVHILRFISQDNENGAMQFRKSYVAIDTFTARLSYLFPGNENYYGNCCYLHIYKSSCCVLQK